MAPSDATLRALGVALPDVSDWSERLPSGKWSQFFKALAERISLVGIARPVLTRRQELLGLARAFRLDKTRWGARAGFNLDRVAKLDAALERELAARRGSYDLVVQLQTLCSPRSPTLESPYVIYTDNTMALTQEIYPGFAPLAPAELDRWQGFEAEVCRGAQRVFTFSEFARRSVVEDYGCPPEAVVAIGAGANQLVDPLPAKDYSRRLALFVGHPFELKGGPVLLRAWQLVRRHLSDAELVLVGPKRNPIRGGAPGVTWRGWVSRTELAALYESASLFVLPSMFDAWGHVFVEAMGHGLPCIGSNVCAMPELIEDGVSGRLVARGAPELLANAIIELLSDPDQAARMGRSGHERVMRQMTWPRVVDRLLSSLS
jgi:glycosyltransferase involved in cell wall biosynthesis